MKHLRLLDYPVVIFDYDKFYNRHKIKSQYLVRPCMLQSGNASKRTIAYSNNKDQELLENGFVCYNYVTRKIFIKPKSIKKINVNVMCIHCYNIYIKEYNDYKNTIVDSRIYYEVIDENDVKHILVDLYENRTNTCQFLQENFNLGKQIKKVTDMFETIFRNNYNHELSHTFTYTFNLRN